MLTHQQQCSVYLHHFQVPKCRVIVRNTHNYMVLSLELSFASVNDSHALDLLELRLHWYHRSLYYSIDFSCCLYYSHYSCRYHDYVRVTVAIAIHVQEVFWPQKCCCLVPFVSQTLHSAWLALVRNLLKSMDPCPICCA